MQSILIEMAIAQFRNTCKTNQAFIMYDTIFKQTNPIAAASDWKRTLSMRFQQRKRISKRRRCFKGKCPHITALPCSRMARKTR